MENLGRIKKWFDMIRGNSILYVNQNEGKKFSIREVRGYYNDFTEKVLSPRVLLDDAGIVYNVTNDGRIIYFPIAIFQYGLGAYDLFLLTGEKKYQFSFMKTVEWAIKNQEKQGAWDVFSNLGTCNKYSAMAQGEGASLLVRAYMATKNEEYLLAAKKSIDFMCRSIEDGGCTHYSKQVIWFKEYIEKPVVLNGWIFSIWGLFDYCKTSRDASYQKVLNNAVESLAQDLKNFDRGFWSKYDRENKIASPFYHRLHIAQLKVMYDLFGLAEFNNFAHQWEACQYNKFYYFLAFAVKAYQKIVEEKSGEAVIVK